MNASLLHASWIRALLPFILLLTALLLCGIDRQLLFAYRFRKLGRKWATDASWKLNALRQVAEVGHSGYDLRIGPMYEEALVALALAGRLNTKGKDSISYERLKALASQAVSIVMKKQMRVLRDPQDSYPLLADDLLANMYFAEQLRGNYHNSIKDVLEAVEHLKKVQQPA